MAQEDQETSQRSDEFVIKWGSGTEVFMEEMGMDAWGGGARATSSTLGEMGLFQQHNRFSDRYINLLSRRTVK